MNANMVRVPAATNTMTPTAGLPPSQVELLQRRCLLDSTSLAARWTGLESACTCRSRYFGADCNKLVNPTARMEKTVGAGGGDVLVDGGHSVSIPSGALAVDVTVSVNLFKREDVGDAFPTVADGFRAVSHLLELLPEGITFSKKVTVSMGMIENEKVKNDRLALFYWDAFSRSWVELTGSAYNKDLKIVQGQSTHFSRWVILEKPAKKTASWGIWVAIAAAIFVVIALLIFAGHRTFIKVKDTAVDQKNEAASNSPMDTQSAMPAQAWPLQPTLQPSAGVIMPVPVVHPVEMGGFP